jgi:outer membrane protein assembly factor BamE (lipoprotein component of BamABCDE complex)
MRLIGRVSRRSAPHVALTGAAALALLAATGGCASIKDHRGYLADPTLIASVQPGVDNRQSVERTLGRPTFVSQFGDPAWYYIAVDTAQSPFGRPRARDEAVLRVNFDAAGNVVAVNRTGIEQVVRLSPDSDKTRTLGRERGFFEDLFGNIGSVGAAGVGGGAPGGGSGN